MPFTNKYKDREPTETIQIINDFFKSKGYDLTVEELKPTECGTWGCIIFLSINNQKLLTSNGKGITKEYALASGYAEMFERFSNKISIYLNAFWGKDVLLKNYQKNKYYMDIDEKLITFDELKKDTFITSWLDTIFSSKKNQEYYIKTLCPISFITLPFKTYDNQEIKYIDPRILTRMQTSTGMAAGNTLEEALVQGLNEIFEHYTSCHFYKEPQNIYYRIDPKYLPTYLQDVINLIEKDNNYKFELYDLSYNFSLPVCMSLLINKNSLTFHPNFGSAPSFELAAERTITETYQNKFNYLNIQKSQEPFETAHWAKRYAAGFRTLTTTQTFDERFFFASKKDTKPNQEIYINYKDNISNNKILDHYTNLLYSNYYVKFYYRNNSKIKNMFAVQIFCPGLDLKAHERIIYKDLTTEEEKQNYLICLKNNCEFLLSMRENNEFSTEQINHLFESMMFNMEHWDFSKFGMLSGSDWLVPIPRPGKPSGLIDIFHVLNRNASLEDIYYNIHTPAYKQTAKYFYTLDNFMHINYPPLKLKEIFKLWDKEITNEDFLYYKDKIYLFKKIIIENFQKLLKSKEYNFFIESFCD